MGTYKKSSSLIRDELLPAVPPHLTEIPPSLDSLRRITPLPTWTRPFLRKEARGFYRNVRSPGNAFSLGHLLSVDDDVHATPRHCPYRCNNTSSHFIASSSKTDTLHARQLLSKKLQAHCILGGIVPPIFSLSSLKLVNLF
jgi:hypothetical protein